MASKRVIEVASTQSFCGNHPFRMSSEERNLSSFSRELSDIILLSVTVDY
jgi:hypothetical protein